MKIETCSTGPSKTQRVVKARQSDRAPREEGDERFPVGGSLERKPPARTVNVEPCGAHLQLQVLSICKHVRSCTSKTRGLVPKRHVVSKTTSGLVNLHQKARQADRPSREEGDERFPVGRSLEGKAAARAINVQPCRMRLQFLDGPIFRWTASI